MTHRNTWKQFERDVAKRIGSTRTPLSGGNSKHTRSDTLHSSLFVECKYRKNCATWNLWNDTANKAKGESKVPMLALRSKGKKGYLVVMHIDDFERVVNEYGDVTNRR